MMLLSFDSKYLFNVNGTYINVFSVISGEVVYKLSYCPTNNTDDDKKNNIKTDLLINSICINPNNKYQLLSFHQNGVICLWDYEDGLFLKAFETKLKIKKIIQVEKKIYAIGQLKPNGSNSLYDQSLSLYKLVINDTTLKESDKCTPIHHQIILSNLMISKDIFEIAIDNNERYVAYIESRKKLVINQFKPSNLMKKLKSKIQLTCLALHPNEDCIATGTISGKIILWYNYLAVLINSTDAMDENNNNRKQKVLKPTTTILHWHSLPVLSLWFTFEGSYLLSGGFECVLVKWLFKTGQKDFKPRLSAPVKEICSSKDNSLYVTRHLDNTIHLIGTNLNVIQTYNNFVCPNFLSNNYSVKKSGEKDWDELNNYTYYPIGLNFFTNLNCLVTNGKPGHLQFYSFTSDKLLFNLDVANENYISPENLNKPNIHTEIEFLCFNHDSNWLATVERRDDLVTTPETKLKFWYFDQVDKKFTLNTLIRFPHSFDKINDIKFKPGSNILFTSGKDGCFKSWALTESDIIGTNPSVSNWIYKSCNGYRDLAPSYISFLKNDQYDLVIVSFNHILTIWSYDEYDGVNLIADLIHCDSNDVINEFTTVNDNHLLTINNNSLNLWNLKISNNLNVEKVQMVAHCIWSQTFDLNEKCQLLRVPDDDRIFKKSQIPLLFIKKNKIQDKRNEANSNIRFLSFMLKESSDNRPQLKTIYSLTLNSLGKIHFASIVKSSFLSEHNINNDDDSEDLLSKIDVYYCDNRGFIQKITNELTNEIDSELNESMWQNRKTLSKKLPDSLVVTNLIDFHRTSKLTKSNELVQQHNTSSLKANIKKIESTPAYLMPKIGSFCYETLKSMLLKLDETNNNNSNKEINLNL